MKKIFLRFIKEEWRGLALILVAVVIVAGIIFLVSGNSDVIDKWVHKPLSDLVLLDLVWLVIIHAFMSRK